VDGGWTHNFLWVLKKSGNRWIPVFRSIDFEKPQFLDRGIDRWVFVDRWILKNHNFEKR
jgi:hypothetical protein